MIGDKYRYYETLEVTDTASNEEIKRQFKLLAKKWHPDRNFGNENQCREKFINIYTAYQVLSDEKARAEYDNFLKALKRSSEIDKLLEQEELFTQWLKKSKKDAKKKYQEFKQKGDDFIDVLINFSTGIIKLTGIGIKKIVDAGKKAINKTLSHDQKKAIKKFSKTTAKGISYFLRGIFNVLLWSGVGLAFGWAIGKHVLEETSGETTMNVVWLGITLIALIYNFIFRKPKGSDN